MLFGRNIRRGKPVMAGIFAAAAFFLSAFISGTDSFAGPALEAEALAVPAAEASAASAESNSREDSFDANRLSMAAEVSSLVLMVGKPGTSDGGALSFYTRGEDGTLSLRFSVPAVNGLNGISADKREGDKKTPSGFYHFTEAFGNLPDPGSVLPYHQLVPGDVWVDDSASRYYNRRVNQYETEKDWSSAERLWLAKGFYDYVLNIGYNMEGTPGKGSAIFLHCPKEVNGDWSYGCISLDRDRVVELIRTVDSRTGILILPDEESLSEYLEDGKTE